MNRLILLIIVFLLPNLGFAQHKWTLKDRWRHSIGGSFHLLHVGENVSPAFGAFYNPQINIINKFTDFSLAATFPMSLGVHIKDSWIEETFFYGQIPAVLEANIGHYATRDFRSKIGMGFGTGYGLQVAGNKVSSGLAFTGAARSWFFSGSLTLRYMFILDLQGNGYNAHTITLAANLGNYFKKLNAMNKLSKWQNFK